VERQSQDKHRAVRDAGRRARSNIEDCVLPPGTGPGAVLECLYAGGIAIVRWHLPYEQVVNLLAEHTFLIERAFGSAVPRGRNGLAMIPATEIRSRFPALRRSFYTDWSRAVARGYLGSHCAYQERVVCTHELRELHPITAPHFDSLRSLKFLIYLLDTDERNGAFRFAPGTHTANAESAQAWRDAGGRVRDTPNVATEDEAGALQSVNGPAGTLVVFDSDGFHSGGMLQPGTERRVVRAQCYPRPRLHLQPRRLSTQWFREVVWNPLLRRSPVPSRPATSGHSNVRAAPQD
jgi:hypothetical protein